MDTGQGNLPAPAVSLGTRSARGFVYLLSGTMTAKLVSVLAQIALAYLLTEQDYGVVALAYTITLVIQVIEQAGVTDVLIHRRRFAIWAIPGFWLSLTLGFLSCLLIALSAPVAARFYDNAQLFWVLLVLAPSSITNSLMAVPRAQLARQLRFRALAALNFTNVSLRLMLTVVFAAFGFGPYSFVMPVPIVTALVAAFAWWWVRPPWSARPYFRRWRYLVKDSSQLLAAGFAMAFNDQSDYMMLGLFRSVAEVGIYYFGFMFSIQMLQLLTGNLTNILFPALTKLNSQPQVQLQGFLKAQRILAMGGISACLMQAAGAAPLARLVFEPKWEPSIIVMQVLSIGMATRMVAASSFALIKSQGRFGTQLGVRWGFAMFQIVALWAVLSRGGAVLAVSVTIAVISTLIGLISFYTAVRPYGAGWATVAQVLLLPATCSVLAVGTAWGLAQAMAQSGYGNIAQLVVTVLVAIGLNALLARLWMRPVWDDLWARVRRLLPNRATPAAATNDDSARNAVP